MLENPHFVTDYQLSSPKEHLDSLRHPNRIVEGTALPRISVAAMEEGGSKGLKAALNEARGKCNPDRTVLPIPDRKFGGAVGRTMDESIADYSFIPGPQAPEGAPNVLIVLVDDADDGLDLLDRLGARRGPTVVVSTDGAAVRRRLGNTAPARLQVVGIVDRVSLAPGKGGR